MSRKYDFIIVGSGFFGSICSYELNKLGKKVLVLESRNHIGGNCFTSNRDDINVHDYGPHIFHTSNDTVWKWINQFVKFNQFVLTPVANYKGEIFSLPFNMWTFSKMWNITHPDEAAKIIESQSKNISEPKNLEEQAIKLVGEDVYRKLIYGYTKKQWRKEPKELPKEIIERLPVRYTYDNNYFNDKYQGIPIGGYTQIFEKLLENVEVKLNVDYLSDKDYWDSQTEKLIYTGPIDRYYNYCFGELEYKTTKFEHKKIDVKNFQGCPVMNFTEEKIPYTRCIEHKHFDDSSSDVSWVSYEYPVEYSALKTEPYYPVNDEYNNKIYNKYKKLSESEINLYFGGRLAEYKYYDMDRVIESALNFVDFFKK
jgi:UDP-galactopyranose mutase